MLEQAPLSDAEFDAILGLAARAPPKPPRNDAPCHAPPSSLGQVRITIWDERRGVRISGKEAPTADELPDFLAANPRCSVYAGQTPADPPSAPSTALSLASSPALIKPCAPKAAAPKRRSEDQSATSEDITTVKRQRRDPPRWNATAGYVPASEETRDAAWQSGGAAKVVEAMRTQPADPIVQADGCGALAWLASGTNDHKRRVCAAGGGAAVVHAMQRHLSSLAVAVQGCGAIAVLALDQSGRETAREVGGAPAVVRAMRMHPNAAQLQQLGCSALASLAELRTLPAEPLAAAVLSAMRSFPQDVPLQAQACRALLQLAAGGAARRRRAVCEAGGADAVVSAMLAHAHEPHVQQWGCGALTALAEGDDACSAAVRRASGVGGARAVVAALDRHRDHPHVAQLGCAALAAMVGGAGGAGAVSAAARSEVLACDGAAAAVRTMDRHVRQWLVQLQGCALLALLASDADAEACAAVRAASGAPAALQALRVHAALPEMQRWAGCVLRALPHPIAPPATVAAAAHRARRLRLCRAMLGSWHLGGDTTAGRDVKLPLDLVSRIADMACSDSHP